MRVSSLLMITIMVASMAYPQVAPPDAFRLDDGTPVRLRLQRTISSADAQVNDEIDFDVLDEVKVNGVVVIPKGSIGWGTVTAAQSKRRLARGGKLNVNTDSVRLANGEKVALRAVKNGSGDGHTGAMAGGMLATAVFVPIAAPLFLLMHGKDVTIPKGTEITAYINGAVDLDRTKFDARNTAPAAPAATAVAAIKPVTAKSTAQADRAAVELSTVVLKSDPDGGEISVDGRFLGNTPSTVQLAPGECTISIQKAGFRTWQRTIAITPGGIVTLTAQMEKN